MSEGKSEDTFGVFFEIDLIDVGYNEEESVKCSDVKSEAIEEANSETFGLSRQISDAVGANGIDKVEQCCQVRAMDALEALSNVDVVLGMEEMVKDLLKVLRNDDYNESDCGVDLSKWHRHTNFEDLDNGNKEYWEPVVDSNLNERPNLENNDRIMRSVFDRRKTLLMKNNGYNGLRNVDYVFEELIWKELETSGTKFLGSSSCHDGEQYAAYLPEK
ncbi:hypothetical protein C2G38_2215816 [Gigaspora rosea]|uniref:Uncharacterized protein n=1 Tax=Gigaspora rosea TaxID=44941 RepID=A0A397U9H2_9GLOM|nr:hypothetical protein C2G38_2215816 [Gigaspora rosea]